MINSCHLKYIELSGYQGLAPRTESPAHRPMRIGLSISSAAKAIAMHCMPNRSPHRKSGFDALGPNEDDAWLSPALSSTRLLPSSSSCPTRTRSFPAFCAPPPFNSDRQATTSELSPALCAFRRPLTVKHTGGSLSRDFGEGKRLDLGRRASFVAYFSHRSWLLTSLS